MNLARQRQPRFACRAERRRRPTARLNESDRELPLRLKLAHRAVLQIVPLVVAGFLNARQLALGGGSFMPANGAGMMIVASQRVQSLSQQCGHPVNGEQHRGQRGSQRGGHGSGPSATCCNLIATAVELLQPLQRLSSLFFMNRGAGRSSVSRSAPDRRCFRVALAESFFEIGA
jgi:hypothetical protein